MTIELIIICVSIFFLSVIYVGRLKSSTGGTLIFSNTFLSKTDDIIFRCITSIFKMYTSVCKIITSFVKEIPHKTMNVVHDISNIIASKSSEWKDRLKGKNGSK